MQHGQGTFQRYNKEDWHTCSQLILGSKNSLIAVSFVKLVRSQL